LLPERFGRKRKYALGKHPEKLILKKPSGIGSSLNLRI
jgi:hypothetical protein